jgi:hypothetical protein
VQELVRKDKKLECNEECSQLERNKRMALALQIRNKHSQHFLSLQDEDATIFLV